MAPFITNESGNAVFLTESKASPFLTEGSTMSTLTLNIAISSPVSTGITFTPIAPFSGAGGNLTAIGPVAAGVTVGTIVVSPAGWAGSLALSGTSAALFTLSGNNLVTAVQLVAGNDVVTITATP